MAPLAEAANTLKNFLALLASGFPLYGTVSFALPVLVICITNSTDELPQIVLRTSNIVHRLHNTIVRQELSGYITNDETVVKQRFYFFRTQVQPKDGKIVGANA